MADLDRDGADDLLAAATAALRDASADAEPPVEETRRRVMASVGPARRSRARRLGFVVFAFALSIGTLSWAATTGRLSAALESMGISSRGEERIAIAMEPVRDPVSGSGSGSDTDTGSDTGSDTDTGTDSGSGTGTDSGSGTGTDSGSGTGTDTGTGSGTGTGSVVRPRSKRVVESAGAIDDRDLAAYRSAHALHFKGNDAKGALAAWDAYLGAHPRGRFVAEARYNRAIVLVRLDRIDEARAALAPFAAGEIAGGYRRREATELRDALAEQP